MIKLTYTFDCSRCCDQENVSIPMTLNDEPMKPSLPAGWSELHGEIFCPMHMIQVHVVDKIKDCPPEYLKVMDENMRELLA